MDNNEPAFPHIRANGYVDRPGMTLRDWFAGQALAGLVSGLIGAPSERAVRAYALADAMLAERAKGQSND